MPSAEKLTCVSILICDDVYRDERTKKMVIVGTFNMINARAFPVRHQRLCVLFTITDGRGEYDFALRIENARTGQSVFEMHGPLELENPLQITDVVVEVADLVFPEAGKYWVILESDREILAQRPFVVQNAATPTPA